MPMIPPRARIVSDIVAAAPILSYRQRSLTLWDRRAHMFCGTVKVTPTTGRTVVKANDEPSRPEKTLCDGWREYRDRRKADVL